MSSLLRRMQRRVERQSADYAAKDRSFRMLPDGGYESLHPTRGWKRFSAKRLRAERRMAQLLGG